MGIKVKLFGDLKKKIKHQDSPTGFPTIIEIEETTVNKVMDVLDQFSIQELEVYHIFVNNKYSWVNKKIKDGDVVSLFPRNMSVLYKWYFKKEED